MVFSGQAGLDHAKLAEALLPIVLEAGAIEMRYFETSVPVEHKADRSPVTIADREAEALIVSGLAAVAPGIPVVAEELASAGDSPPTDDVFFLVDPLDGTREFIRNGREFTVNIGLVMGGRPVFGVIYAPALARLYVTVGPASAALALVAPEPAEARRVLGNATALQTRTAKPHAIVALESRYRRKLNLDGLLQNHVVTERIVAASSYKFCLVAEGTADVYAQFGETCEWDTAAGEAILAAAGGATMALDHQSLVYGQGEGKFANPPFIAWGRLPPAPW